MDREVRGIYIVMLDKAGKVQRLPDKKWARVLLLGLIDQDLEIGFDIGLKILR